MSNLDFSELGKKSYSWLGIHGKTVIIGIILPLVIFSILAWQVNQAREGFSWEIAILLKIHNNAQPLLDKIARPLTNLGGFPGVMGLSIPIVLWLVYQKQWQKLAYFSVTILGNEILSFSTKILFHRIRPDLWEAAYIPAQKFAFPSGHAMRTLTFFIVLLMLTKGSRWNIVVSLFSGLFVFVIAWTRLYLGVHFPSDILGGWLIAIAWTTGMSLLFDSLWHKEN